MPHMASVATLTGVLANRLEHRSTYYSFIIPDLGPAPETVNRLDTADESGPRFGLSCILYLPCHTARRLDAWHTNVGSPTGSSIVGV